MDTPVAQKNGLRCKDYQRRGDRGGIGEDGDFALLSDRAGSFRIRIADGEIIPTRYRVYFREDLSFPLGIPYPPSGMGHTVFYDISNMYGRWCYDMHAMKGSV